MRKKGNKTEISLIINNRTYDNIYKRLKLLALSIFEWEGLPPTCNARYLEKCLFDYGIAVIFDKKELGIINSKVTTNGTLNHYEEPTGYLANSSTFTEFLKPEECVIVRNNIEELSTSETIDLFCYRLFETQRTIDVNIKAQKTPVLIVGDDKSILTLKNVYMQYDGNEPVIYGDKNTDISTDKFKSLKTDAPFVADKLYKCKHEIMNEFLSFLGVNNADTDKKERLITDEVNANNELIDLCLYTMLSTRQEACRELKEKFGLNVTVKVRDFKKEELENFDKVGEEDE